ncbi:MAG: Rrf2 family transcriptional regulator [Gammaproteobacteria bacterium]|nr:Rrf2 family transcriptional regulator [Gammaproteobacteria bacterium]
MRLSTKSRYAVTAMLDLALNGTQGPVTLADISENQSISLSYLEQLFAALRSKGLVRGVRGPGGGYYLGREADTITVADIICAVDEWVEYTRSSAYRGSKDAQPQTTRALWDDLSEQIFDFLDDITLSSLVVRGAERATASVPETAKTLSLGLRGEAA